MIPVLAVATMLSLAAAVIGLALIAGALWMAEPTFVGPVDTQLQLQTSVTKTASFNSTAIDLGSGFAPGGAGQAMQANIRVSAIVINDNDESYTFKVQDSPDNSTFTDRSEGRVLLATASAAAGVLAIICGITQRYVRLVVTISGTTPSITYEAWLSPYTVGAG